MRGTELMEEGLQTLISFAKRKGNPSVTIIEDVSDDELDGILDIAGRLRVHVLRVSQSDHVAIISCPDVAIQIAKQFRKRCQHMYNDYVRRPKTPLIIKPPADAHWTVLRDNGFVVQAYSRNGNEISEFLNTKLDVVDCNHLQEIHMNWRNSSSSNYSSRFYPQILQYSRKYFVLEGAFNEERQCYYPSGESAQEVMDRNKLEKLFRQLGFKSL